MHISAINDGTFLPSAAHKLVMNHVLGFGFLAHCESEATHRDGRVLLSARLATFQLHN